jgi:hypothetical protein
MARLYDAQKKHSYMPWECFFLYFCAIINP